MKNKVFVVQDVPKLNLLPAKEFGELTFMLPAGDMFRFPDKTVGKLIYFLEDMTFQDYILPIGDPILIGLALAVASRYGPPHFRVLRWDRQESKYDVLTFPRVP